MLAFSSLIIKIVWYGVLYPTIAVEDQMFLEMQDFNFAQIVSNLSKFRFNFTQFRFIFVKCPNFSNLIKFAQIESILSKTFLLRASSKGPPPQIEMSFRIFRLNFS